MRNLILTPAYGRDYTTPSEVIKDWDNDKDFIIHSEDGKSTYINKSDFIRLRGTNPIQNVEYIHFRYRKLTKRKVIKVTKETLTKEEAV